MVKIRRKSTAFASRKCEVSVMFRNRDGNPISDIHAKRAIHALWNPAITAQFPQTLPIATAISLSDKKAMLGRYYSLC